MVYDDDTGRRVHLGLPSESTEELAARMTSPPTPGAAEKIKEAVQRRARGRNNLAKVDPSQVKSDLRYQHPSIDVTVEQVAWVMVALMSELR